jgi:hypothetical protein
VRGCTGADLLHSWRLGCNYESPVFLIKLWRLNNETSHQTCHVRVDRWQPRLLPGASGRERAQDHAPGARGAGLPRDRAVAGGDAVRQHRLARRFAQVRRFVQEAPRGDRRRAGDAAQLWRGARHRRRAALGRAGRAGADPGIPRRPGQDDRRRPPRLLLRQDVGVQQPAPVWHQVFADQPALRRSGERSLQAGPGALCRHLPHHARLQECAHRRDRRAPDRVQHRALQREAARTQRHLGGNARPLRGALAASTGSTTRLASSRPSWRRSASTSRRRACRKRRCCAWRSSARSSTTG